MQKEIERLDKELQSITEKLTAQIEERVWSKYETDKTMMLKDFEWEKKIYEINIQNLQSKISDLQKNNEQLQKLLDSTNKKLEQLAEKVVEWNRPMIYWSNNKND